MAQCPSADGGSVEPASLADDINIALRTTASGLAIAIPLMILVANVNIRIAKMEDLVGAGLSRFMSMFRSSLGDGPSEDRYPSAAAAESMAQARPE